MKKQFRLFGLKVWEERVEEPEQRSLTITDGSTLANPSAAIVSALGGGLSEAGVTVNHRTVLTLTAVWRAVNVISGTIASLPLQVYKKGTDGSRQLLPDHPVQKVVNRPNGIMTDYIFRETLQASLLLHGDAFAVIIRDQGRPVGLLPVLKPDVYVFQNDQRLSYKVRLNDVIFTVDSKDMVHVPGLGFDGIQGYSPISIMAESMGVALAAQRFGARFFGRGANMSGVVEVPGVMKDDVYDRFKTSWDDTYSGICNSFKTAILEGGSKFNRIGIPPEEAQFIQTRQFQVAEVARMFGVQPHMLMDLERSTNNNIEHQGMEFVSFTLMPWVARWEAELNRKLFSNLEKADHYLEYNLTALLRGDAKSRSEYYRGLFAIGAMSPNEIRRLENQSAYEGGDQYFAQAGYMPINALENYHLSKNKTNGNEEK